MRLYYIDVARVESFFLRESLNTAPACSSRAKETHLKDKPDMIEVDTTYSWQMPHGVDDRGGCASVPVVSTNNIHADTGVSMPVSAFLYPNIPRFISLV